MTNWVVGFAAAFHVVLAAFERTPPPCHAVSGLRAATQGCLSHHVAASSGHEGVKVPAVEEEAVQGLIQLKSLLHKIQHLDYDTGFGADTANSTPRVWSSPATAIAVEPFTAVSLRRHERNSTGDLCGVSWC